MIKQHIAFLLLAFVPLLSGCQSETEQATSLTPKAWEWETIPTEEMPIARHEAGLAVVDHQIYLIGGRRINPTSIFNTENQQWSQGAPTPIELHHFQPVTHDGKIYIVGALTGKWPNEKPVERVIIYDPKLDEYEWGHDIPKHRQRGGAGAVVFNNKIFIIGGIVNGHMDGYKPWFDEYDPATGLWTALADSPHARDHFQAVMVNKKLYAFAGRTSSKRTNQDMDLTVAHGDIYDFDKQKWLQTSSDTEIPTMRAGNGAFVWNKQVVIGGGESMSQVSAHNEIEAFDTQLKKWKSWPNLNQGRHGTGFVIVNGYVYTASGCGKRGGEPELYSLERLKLPEITPSSIPNRVSNPKQVSLPVHKQWHTVTLNFKGPMVAENDEHNPFLHYKLLVEVSHPQSKMNFTIPGYFAADGDSAESGASKGDLWQVKFNPPKQGIWQYQAKLYAGKNISISPTYNSAKEIILPSAQGEFLVIPSDKHGVDFRAHGRLIADKGYFKFQNTNSYWLKGGTNSPENLLGYQDFDNTYRIPAKARDGEAAPNQALHQYSEHLKDWNTGDPQWKNEKGRSLIGAFNYLASQGMNSAYFLTMNILGDGKDVWPYLSHENFTRFDVSKLAQWEIVFEHMQAKGILLHMVIQETENELMLDNGDTGPLRQLYLNELIARFGHHLGLAWNLGEENGFAQWTPKAQNTEQRKAMASYLKKQSAFSHPVLLHTHSHDPDRENILTPLLGFKDIDGLSLQVDKRKQVFQVVQRWKKASQEKEHDWLITMDEIGMWHTAALPDSLDSKHLSLQRHALWGSLLAGAAGVEWYFGAKHPHNDLTSEDWRQREKLWELTEISKQFFELHLPYAQMTACSNKAMDDAEVYCSQQAHNLFVLYMQKGTSFNVQLPLGIGTSKIYDIYWFDPVQGGELQRGSKESVKNETFIYIGQPPKNHQTDWVIVLKKQA